MARHTTPAGNSVLDELGLDDQFVDKAMLAIALMRHAAERELTPAQLGSLTGLSEEQLLWIKTGDLEQLSSADLDRALAAVIERRS